LTPISSPGKQVEKEEDPQLILNQQREREKQRSQKLDEEKEKQPKKKF
jgi:hypothetical protein